MNGCTVKMLWRSIRSSLGRYLAILAIVALGVGFFAGLKSSQPAMVSTADSYLRRTHMQDFQMLSSLGFTDEDVEAFQAHEGVAGAEGAYFADAIGEIGGKREVWHFMSLTEKVSVPVLTAGRMPENAGECLADAGALDEEDIGSVITVAADNDGDTLALFSRESYIVVGLAQSPRYISIDRGNTSLGTGSVAGFIILPPEGFDSEAWHELLVWCDLPGAIYSEEYAAALDRLETPLKELLNGRGRLRYRQLRQEAEEELADARRELDEGWEEYDSGKEDALIELYDAEVQLTQAEKDWRDGRAEIIANQQALEDAMAQIPAARAEIEDNRRDLEEKQEQLAEYRRLFDEAKQQLNDREDELRELLEREETAHYAALEPYYREVALRQAEVLALQAQIEAIKNGEGDPAALPALEAQLAEAETALAAARAELEEQERNYDPETAEVLDAEAVISNLRAYAAELESQLAENEQALADGFAQLDAAAAQLDALEAGYPENLRQIKKAWTELDTAWQEIEDGWAELESGRIQADIELEEGRAKLLAGEEELADARRELEETLTLDVYLLDRSTNSGYVTFENDSSIVDAVANAFPIFFVLIAALVCVTTMTRMVNEERTIIGTMKAMGYGAGTIMSKYLAYAGSSALLGCVAGFFLGTTAIPYIVWVAYNIMYDYAALDFYFSPGMYAECLAVSVPGALLVTWLACRKELAERPAELIRPKAPGKGKRILLEYITPLWRRLSFLSKVTVRNAFRYRQRVFMMLLGIGGCTALMVAGFGARDSIADISTYQYEEIFLYDMAVTLDPEEFDSDARAAAYWQDETERYAMTWQDTVTLVGEDGEKSTRVIAAAEEELRDVISLHSKAGELAYPGPGEAVITQKLSDKLDLHPGDTAELQLSDGDTVTVTISGVCENFLSHYIYVSPETVGSPAHNTALLCVREGSDPRALAARLRSEDGVSYVALASQERETIEQSMASLDLLVVMLVVCSGVLAFITLYNLTNINIMERTREIATVKVLGFYPGETASYILRENLMLSFLGAGLGLLLGKVLHRFIMELIDVENMTCDIRILPMSYAISFVVTILFAILTNSVMRLKLEKVDMAESLKSVE